MSVIIRYISATINIVSKLKKVLEIYSRHLLNMSLKAMALTRELSFNIEINSFDIAGRITLIVWGRIISVKA